MQLLKTPASGFVLLARRMFVAAFLAGSLVACSDGSSSGRGPAESLSRTGSARTALQAGDLPDDVERCSYSAPIPKYLENIAEIDRDSHDSVSSAWDKFRAVGAIEGYIAVFARTPRVCQYWLTGPPMNHDHGAMRLASSIVIRFKDVPEAEEAYRSDLFGQSQLNGSDGAEVALGPATGLGSNSVKWFDGRAAQVVWQTGAFNIFVATRNLSRDEVDGAISALDTRSLRAQP